MKEKSIRSNEEEVSLIELSDEEENFAQAKMMKRNRNTLDSD